MKHTFPFSTFRVPALVCTLALLVTLFSETAAAQGPSSPQNNRGGATGTPQVELQTNAPQEAPARSKATGTDQAQERVGEQRARIAERLQHRIINLGRNMTVRMQSAHDRFDNIAGRIEARIDILASNGVDTAEAELSLDAARTLLANIDETLDSLDAILVKSVQSEEPRSAFQTLKNVLLDTKDELIATHQQLRETLTLLKEAVREAQLDRGVSGAVANERSFQNGTTSEAGDIDTATGTDAAE